MLNNKKKNLADGWDYRPDYIADRPEDILEIINIIKNV